MKTSPRRIGFGPVIAVVAGCSHLPSPFGGTWPLPAEHRSSPAVDLARPIVQPVAGGLQVSGCLTKQPGAATTANSHVGVQAVDASGTVRQEQPVAFAPAALAGGLRSRPSTRYEVALTAPLGTAGVRVVAHDRPHGT